MTSGSTNTTLPVNCTLRPWAEFHVDRDALIGDFAGLVIGVFQSSLDRQAIHPQDANQGIAGLDPFAQAASDFLHDPVDGRHDLAAADVFFTSAASAFFASAV